VSKVGSSGIFGKNSDSEVRIDIIVEDILDRCGPRSAFPSFFQDDEVRRHCLGLDMAGAGRSGVDVQLDLKAERDAAKEDARVDAEESSGLPLSADFNGGNFVQLEDFCPRFFKPADKTC